ncbi:MAG: hypothetical protein L3J51_09530 [Cocleimonas sp.]|nr:hypothetical protein [Cocleimonas sp.]
MSDGINHNALKLLIEAGAVDTATVIANADQWALRIKFGDAEKTILAKNSGKARIWRKLDTLAKYLSGLGINHFETDLTNYDPSKKTLTRPDSAAILKKTHEAHRSQQEKEEIQEAIIAIDKKASPDKVKVNWEQRRARILKQENPRVK